MIATRTSFVSSPTIFGAGFLFAFVENCIMTQRFDIFFIDNCLTSFANLIFMTKLSASFSTIHNPIALDVRFANTYPSNQFSKIIKYSCFSTGSLNSVNILNKLSILIFKIYCDSNIVTITPNAMCLFAQGECVNPITVQAGIKNLIVVSKIRNIVCVCQICSNANNRSSPYTSLLNQ